MTLQPNITSSNHPLDTLSLPVSCSNDCVDSPSLAIVKITPDLAARIRQLSRTVVELGVYDTSQYDYTPEWYRQEEALTERESQDPPSSFMPADVECVCLHVTKDEFWWEGYIEHTDVTCRTESVAVADLPPIDVLCRAASTGST